MPEPIVLGVDAGNTKTEAVALDSTGHVRGYARSGTGDIYTGERAAIDQVRDAVDRALHEAGATEPTASALRLAGVDWDEDATLWRQVLVGAWGWRGSFSLLNDGFASLRLGQLDGVGLSVTAGTAAAICGRGPTGIEFGLNNRFVHDLGALGIGAAAFRAVALAELGMAESTSLGDLMAEHFGLPDAAALVHAVRARHPAIAHADLATAAPVVSAAADDGEATATAIVDEQARLLAEYSRAIAHRCGFTGREAFSVVLNGSVLRQGRSRYSLRVHEHLQDLLPGGVLHTPEQPPVVGAGLDALAEAGLVLTEAIAGRVEAGYAARIGVA